MELLQSIFTFTGHYNFNALMFHYALSKGINTPILETKNDSSLG